MAAAAAAAVVVVVVLVVVVVVAVEVMVEVVGIVDSMTRMVIVRHQKERAPWTKTRKSGKTAT